MALVLAPYAPLQDWLSEFDSVNERSPGFFDGRVIIVDLAAIRMSRDELKSLLNALTARGIRILGIEGAQAGLLDAGMPPPVNGGRPAGPIEIPDAAPALPPPPAPERSLMVETSLRSGQSILHTEGDVTILGSVASGAEIVAGGSIHIYGALRGRAIAGCSGNAKARIFCRKFQAELIAIDGLYKTADDLGKAFHGHPIQAGLDGDQLSLKILD